jgi:23S rRNA (adenine2030-N6)-methyltransferase
MLSYQHGYHAGNRADVLKHAVLHALLTEIGAGPKPVLYVETHSGRGRYDLTGEQARKGGEAVTGVQLLQAAKAPKAMRPWLAEVDRRGKTDYPGSPALAQALLPPSARMVFFEKHPAEFAALTKSVGADQRVQVKQADGYSGALKLSPRAGEQMVCFVDPSYETTRDIDALALWTPRALKRWPQGILILWLPLFRDGREAEFGEYLGGLEECIIAGARWPIDPEDESALEGSAIVAFRAPSAAADTCHAIAASLQSWWPAAFGNRAT